MSPRRTPPLSAPGATTTIHDCLVVITAARGDDNAGAAFSSWTNSDLANLTEQFDDGTTQGNGGGLAVVTGEKATAGSYGATTATLAVNSSKGFMTIALKPSDAPRHQRLPTRQRRP